MSAVLQPVDRRRNHRLRHLVNCAYGLGLLCGSFQLSASERAVLTHLNQAHDEAVMEARSTSTSPRLVFVGLQAWGWSQSDLHDFLRGREHLPEAVRRNLLDGLDGLRLEQLHFKRHPIRSLKNGLGFDYHMEGGGTFFFDLYQRRKRRNESVRVELNPLDRQGATGPTSSWCLGLTADYVRTVDGDKNVALKPQLLLDLDRLLHWNDGQIEASLEYGHWLSSARRATADVQVAQATIRMRF